ncbi:MAG TPA: hypothetical protein VMM76_06560 [Pirellulaceae bacterium]|nr:hypothetical protein [Pirellulaceae bacterium]
MTCAVTGAITGIIVGVLVGMVSPFWRPFAAWIGIPGLDAGGFELAEQLAFQVTGWLLGFGLLIGLLAGTVTALLTKLLRGAPAQPFLLPPVAIMCGCVAAMVLSELAVRAIQPGSPYTIYSIFGPAEGFIVTVTATLYAGLWTQHRLTNRST